MPEETEHGFYKVPQEEQVAARPDAEAEQVPEVAEAVSETRVEAPHDGLEQKVAKWEPGKFLAQKDAKVDELNKKAATYDAAAERTLADAKVAEQALAQVGREVGPDVQAKVDAETGVYRERAGEARGKADAVNAEFAEYGTAREQAVGQIVGEVEKKDAAEGNVVEALNREVQKLSAQVEKLRAWEAIAAKRKSELAKLGKSLQGKVGDDMTRKEGDVANTVAKLEAQQVGIQGAIQKHDAARQVLKNLQRDIRL